MAMVLPDFSLFPVMKANAGGGSVEECLSAYSAVVDWEMVDGALVGRMPICERLMPSQARRPVLAKLIAGIGSKGVASTDALAYYVTNQRPYASDSWIDAMMIALAGIPFDQDYIGDYPHNIRLYTALNASDWNLIRSGESFTANHLSPNVQNALTRLLLLSRTRMEGGSVDPARWPNLSPSALILHAELIEEPVLIGFVGFGTSVGTVDSAVANHEMRKQELNREPLYQPAVRRKLKLTIGSAANGQHVETGFSEVLPDPKLPPTQWKDLPEATAKAFKARFGGG
jgi:hypothetical protein